MAVETDDIEDIDEDLATAVGLFTLSDATLPQAASHAGITTWELEEAITDTGLADVLDINPDTDVRDEIDRLLDDSQ
jgi:hypothetical protein